MKISSVNLQHFTPSGRLEETYKNHTKTLVIVMSPSILDTQPKMATTCGQKGTEVQTSRDER